MKFNKKVIDALEIIDHLENLPRDFEPDLGDLWDALIRIKGILEK